MIQLESLRKKEHFLLVLKQKAVSNNFFSIYRKKNFIKNSKQSKKKLYISFVMKKKIGTAVKRNRIKRKLRGIVQKLLKIDSAINLNYTYIVLGKKGLIKNVTTLCMRKWKKVLKNWKI